MRHLINLSSTQLISTLTIIQQVWDTSKPPTQLMSKHKGLPNGNLTNLKIPLHSMRSQRHRNNNPLHCMPSIHSNKDETPAACSTCPPTNRTASWTWTKTQFHSTRTAKSGKIRIIKMCDTQHSHSLNGRHRNRNQLLVTIFLQGPS